MKGKNVLKIIALIVFLVIIVSFLFWRFQGNRTYNIYILDKTVPTADRAEHKSFNWILSHHRYLKKNGKNYSYKDDYYGFFPLKDRQYKVRSLRLYEVLSVPDNLDLVYYTDTYGVTNQDWYNRQAGEFNSQFLYGGLNQNDYLLLSEMKRKNKLIIAEFNILTSPTTPLIRQKTETLFDFSWTGWTGCYMNSLQESNRALPRWIVEKYEQNYKKKWVFEGTGIVLVHENGEIVVIDSKTYLTQPYPQIITGEYGQKNYLLPAIQNCTFWFDIIHAGTANKIVSSYKLAVNKKGAELLEKIGLANEFPAIIEHLGNYKFYYFAGDFADRNISLGTSYFKGVDKLIKPFCASDATSKQAFFWRFYLPLVENILEKNLSSTIRE